MKEVWKDIKEYPGYQVSNLGRVNSFKRYKSGKIKIQFIKKVTKNYSRCNVTLSKNAKCYCLRVHRLVAEAFIPNPENKPEVNHKDSNPLNNIVSNLEWSTRKENMDHQQNQYKKVHKKINMEIKNKYDNGEKIIDIANHFNVHVTTIYNRIKFFGWNRTKVTKYNLNNDNLIIDFKNGMTNIDMAIKHFTTSTRIATARYSLKKRGML